MSKVIIYLEVDIPNIEEDVVHVIRHPNNWTVLDKGCINIKHKDFLKQNKLKMPCKKKTQ